MNVWRTGVCVLLVGIFAGACTQGPPPTTPVVSVVADGFLSGPLDLRQMTAVVRVAPPEVLRRAFELASAQVHDMDIARFLMVQARGSFGSGFVVVRRRAGVDRAFLITNRHVVENSEEAEVAFADGISLAHCPILMLHPTEDIAVLGLPAAAPFRYGFAIASEAAYDRQTVIATGYPALDGNPSFQTTEGKVSNAANDGLIQHTAAIDPGSSGGPLTDERGRLVGVNVAVARGRQSVSFAVPSRAVTEAVDAALDVERERAAPDFLRREVMNACERFASELAASETEMHARLVLDMLSISLVASQGAASFGFARTRLGGEASAKLMESFTRSPFDAYRVSIALHLRIRGLAQGGILGRCVATGGVSPWGVPMQVLTRDASLALTFGWDRGKVRVTGGDFAEAPSSAPQGKGPGR